MRRKVAEATEFLAHAKASLFEGTTADDKAKLGGRELKLLYEQVVDLHTQAVILSARIGAPPSGAYQNSSASPSAAGTTDS